MFGGAAQAPDLPPVTVSGCGSSALTTTLAEAERDTRSEQRPAVLLRPRGSPPAADPNHGSPAPAQGEHRVLRVPLCVKRGPSSL